MAGQSFIIDKLTDLVEEAVYKEFEAISERGGVLGAMDTMYQRGKIQEESLYYEQQEARRRAAADRRQHVPAEGARRRHPTTIELIRSTEEEKGQQIANVQRLSAGAQWLCQRTNCVRLQATARERRNVFASLMDAVKTHSLGQISHALYEVGGEYRRNM